jgi:hypothetical protein
LRISRFWVSPISAANPSAESFSYGGKHDVIRMRAKLKAIKTDLHRKMHETIGAPGVGFAPS